MGDYRILFKLEVIITYIFILKKFNSNYLIYHGSCMRVWFIIYSNILFGLMGGILIDGREGKKK